MALIAERVAAAQAGTNAFVITKVRSGWVVIGDVQFLPGYCVLLADPVVPTAAPASRSASSPAWTQTRRSRHLR